MTVNNARPKVNRRAHVVVIGGGYAGALAANGLQQNRDIDITVINSRTVFVERVRLHQLVARSGEATVDLAGLLGDRVGLIVDTAARIDAAGRTVELASGARVSYDYLIYAVGSTATVPAGVPGAREFAYPIGELEQARPARSVHQGDGLHHRRQADRQGEPPARQLQLARRQEAARVEHGGCLVSAPEGAVLEKEMDRAALINVAYRLLGSIADAEDVAQETYLRWYKLTEGERDGIRTPAAWGVRVATRICLDILTSARHRRERYVGPWLPEPIPGQRADTPGSSADPADLVAIDESVSIAMIVVLDAMTPAERVSFVLRDVFHYPFREISDILGRSEAACRQLATSARRRVGTARPHPRDVKTHNDMTTKLRLALQRGDVNALIGLLDPDVSVVNDGGGRVRAALQPDRERERPSGSTDATRRCDDRGSDRGSPRSADHPTVGGPQLRQTAALVTLLTGRRVWSRSGSSCRPRVRGYRSSRPAPGDDRRSRSASAPPLHRGTVRRASSHRRSHPDA